MSKQERHSFVATMRRAALPLASYYAVTLGLPLANGAASTGERFVDHALVVLAVPFVVLFAVWVVTQAAARLRAPAETPWRRARRQSP